MKGIVKFLKKKLKPRSNAEVARVQWTETVLYLKEGSMKGYQLLKPNGDVKPLSEEEFLQYIGKAVSFGHVTWRSHPPKNGKVVEE